MGESSRATSAVVDGIRELLVDAPGTWASPFDGVLAAVRAGEPRRAAVLLAEAEQSTAAADGEIVAALRYLTWALEHRWWPGPVGGVADVSSPLLPPPRPTPVSSTARWWCDVATDSLFVRTMATGAARPGPDQAAVMIASLRPRLDDWLTWADASEEAALRVHARLLYGETARRGAQFELARAALHEAGAHAGTPALRGLVLLAAGDAVLTPMASPEAFGVDLEARDVEPWVADEAARREASDLYTAAGDAFAAAGTAARGSAAVSLRLAWLDRLAGRVAAARERLDGLVADADPAHRLLALVHRALLDLASGRLATVRPGPVDEITTWALGPGSPSLAVGAAGIAHAAGNAARGRGDVEESLATYGFALRLLRALGARSQELLVLSDLNDVYERVNSRGAAIAIYEEALADAWRLAPGEEAIGSVTWLHISQLTTALVHQVCRERDPDALPPIVERLKDLLRRAPGGPRPLLRETDTLARLERAAALLESLGADRGGPLGGGSRTWAEMEAAHVDLAAEGISATIGFAEVMVARLRGELARERGEDVRADRAFAEAAALARDREPALGLTVLAHRRRFDELRARTRDYLGEGLAIDPSSAARMWLIARLPGEAHRALVVGKAEEPPPRSEFWSPDWDGCELRARIALARDRPEDAITIASEGIERFERWFAALTSDTFRVRAADDVAVRQLHQTVASAAHRLGDHEQAFAAADRFRSFGLGSLAAEAVVEGTPTGAAWRRWRQARAEWSGAFDRRRTAWRSASSTAHERSAAALDEAQAALDEATATLEDLEPGATTGRRPSLPAVEAGDVAAALDPDTVLVHVLFGDDELLVSTVTTEGVTVDRQELDTAGLRGAAVRLHRAWSDPWCPQRDEDAAEIARLLLAPATHALEHRSRIVVVPFSTTHLLPFAALPWDGGRLGDRWTVSQLPAASLVPRLAGRPRPRRSPAAVVVGDPATDPARGVRRLPGARLEASAVARSLGVEPLVDVDADEEAVRRRLHGGTGILHLATHGLLDEDAPDLSALVLAGTDELTVAELHGLGLDVDLAVLSACDSGRGELTQGGEVVGLSRGLLAAGVRHTIASQWPVDDRAACLTMTDAADRLAAGDSVAEALAGAQRRLRAEPESEREERYRALAEQVGTEAARGGVRSTRDLRLPGQLAEIPHDHPWTWAPFVHLGM